MNPSNLSSPRKSLPSTATYGTALICIVLSHARYMTVCNKEIGACSVGFLSVYPQLCLRVGVRISVVFVDVSVRLLGPHRACAAAVPFSTRSATTEIVCECFCVRCTRLKVA